MSRPGKIALSATLLSLAVAIGWPVGAHYRAKWKVAGYKRLLRAKGERLAVAELVPPPQGNRENGADDLIAVIKRINSSSAPGVLPAMRSTGPGHALVAWEQEMLPTTLSPNVWPELRRSIRGEEDTLAEIRAALNRPVLDFNLDYSGSFKLSLGHLTQVRSAAQWLSAATILELHDRRATNAFENLNALTRLVARYHNEPLMISELVRVAIGQIAVNTAWEALQSRDLPDEPLAELQAAWVSVDLLHQAELALAMERALGEIVFAENREVFGPVIAPIGGSIGASQSPGLAELAELGSGLLSDPGTGLKQIARRYPGYWAWKCWWSYEDELVNAQVFQAAIETTRTGNHALAPALRQLDRTVTRIRELHPGAGNWLDFSQLNDQMIASFLSRISKLEMQRRLLVTAIALKRCQLRHGEYPRDLAALAPEFLREVPRDAMDGKPLRYRLEADGSFLLYSVGADGEDNGGDASPTEIATPNKEFWRGRDAVWPRPASPEEVKAYRTVIRSWRRRNPGAPGIVVTNRMSETRLKELIRIYPPVFALPP